MSEYDKTPRERPWGQESDRRRARSHWDDDQRIEVGRHAREMQAVVEPIDGGPKRDFTSPHDLLEAELSDEDKDTAQRRKSPTDAPANLRQLINVAAHNNKHHAEAKAAIEAVSNSVLAIEASTAPAKMAALAQRLETLEADDCDYRKRLERMERQHGIATWIVRTLAGGAVAATLWLVHGIWDRSALEERARMRLEIVEEKLNEMRAYHNKGMP